MYTFFKSYAVNMRSTEIGYKKMNNIFIRDDIVVNTVNKVVI